MYECKTVQDMICLMSSKIKEMGESLSDQQVSSFINEILGADRIYVMGAGRSGLVAKAFAMRLMHLGLKSYGKTVIKPIKQCFRGFMQKRIDTAYDYLRIHVNNLFVSRVVNCCYLNTHIK